MDAAKSEISRSRMSGDVERGKPAGPDVLGSVCSVASYGQAAAAAGAGGCAHCPSVANMVVTKSSRVHVGPKFIMVTQNATNNNVIRGWLCARLQNVRCHGAVVVCVCWACVLAAAMCALALHLLLPRNKRLDIGLREQWYLRRDDWQAMPAYSTYYLSLPVKTVVITHSATASCHDRYTCIKEVLAIQQDHLRREYDDIGPNFLVGGSGLTFEGRGANARGAAVASWNQRIISVMFLEVSLGQYLARALRTASPAERLAAAATAAALLLSAALAVYFTIIYTQSEDCLPDIAPHEWFITRDMWLAQPFNKSSPLPAEQGPPGLVIINHSVSTECHRFIACAAELRNLQGYFIAKSQYDIPYNFLIGNDGRVYEGRGWSVEGAHTRYYNKCSIGIGFIGDYREEGMKTEVSSLQINRTFRLLGEGVRGGWLSPEYRVVGARDLQPSASPGDLLYRVMQTWERYAGDDYRGLNCTYVSLLH